MTGTKNGMNRNDAMLDMKIEVKNDLLSQLLVSASFAGKNGLPATAQAFRDCARLIRDTWRGWAGGAQVPGIDPIKRPSLSYMRSIRMTENSAFNWDIFSDSPYARRIADGTSPLDMKKTHPYGRKSRVSKKGVPYLIVPFRWGTPSASGRFGRNMTELVHTAVSSRKFRKSARTGDTHYEKNARGESVRRSEYTWGSRLEKGEADIPEAAGMVRMDAGRGSAYFTFRVISAKSPAGSWIRPGEKPVDVPGAVARALEGYVNTAVEAALMADLGMQG